MHPTVFPDGAVQNVVYPHPSGQQGTEEVMERQGATLTQDYGSSDLAPRRNDRETGVGALPVFPRQTGGPEERERPRDGKGLEEEPAHLVNGWIAAG